MKIEKIMPTVMGILIIVLLAIATSCSTTNKLSNRKTVKSLNKNYMASHNFNACPAYQ